MSTRQQSARSDPPRTVGHVEEGSAFLELAGVRGGTGQAGVDKSATLPSPAGLTEHAFAFYRTAALRAAVGLDVFTAIGSGHDTPELLAQRCEASERGVRILCDYLVSLGVLERTQGRYSAAPDAAVYLDRRSPAFIGDALDFIASKTTLEAVLADPAASVRKGGSVLRDGEHLAAPNQADWTTYARALAPMMARSAAILAKTIAGGDGEIRRVLDVAAGPGQTGIALAQRLPDAEVTALDWAPVLEVAEENARAAGLGERWRALPGSALETELGGPYDIVLVARFLHLLAGDQCEAVLRRLHAALAPEGRIVVLQLVLDGDHVHPPFAAMMNFSVLATTPHGRIRTAAEVEALLREAGFDHFAWHDLPDSDERIVVGRKQA